jgi:hypothetical protein
MSRLTIRRAGYMDRLSAASQERSRLPLREIIGRLRGGENLCDLARSFGLLTDRDEEMHLRRDWYGEGEPDDRSRWWPDFNVEGIVRAGYLQALGLVESLDLPLAAYWLTGHPDFVAVVLPSRYQVTFTLLTPEPTLGGSRRLIDEGVTIYEDAGHIHLDPGVMK